MQMLRGMALGIGRGRTVNAQLCCVLICVCLQVVYGVLRYSRFLNAFLASFWDKNR